jgi:hypothetical protein
MDEGYEVHKYFWQTQVIQISQIPIGILTLTNLEDKKQIKINGWSDVN